MILNKPLKDYVFVIVQVLLFTVYFLSVQFTTVEFPGWLRYSALGFVGVSGIFGVMALLQLNTNLSPFPSPLARGQLVTHGVFRISRHPIYTALIFMSFAFAVYQASLFKFLIAGLIMILFYFKSRYEESLLSEKFPEYRTYKKKTRRFI